MSNNFFEFAKIRKNTEIAGERGDFFILISIKY